MVVKIDKKLFTEPNYENPIDNLVSRTVASSPLSDQYFNCSNYLNDSDTFPCNSKGPDLSNNLNHSDIP